MTARCLRSKRLRAALFFAADGRCRACGGELQTGWHADHVEPWCVTGRTNVHEMQALCPACNLRKGSKSMKDRSHQAEMRKIADAIVSGTWPRKEVITDTTPGGGKTGQSVILGAALHEAGIVKQTLHFVPRSALRPQVREAWGNEAWNPWGFKLHESNNAAPLYPADYVGVVASYEQLVANPDLYVEAARRVPTLVVLDELQFLGDKKNRAWMQAVRRVVDVAKHVLGMSGTLFRHDGQELPFVRYEAGVSPQQDPCKRYAQSDIHFPLGRAVEELAVKRALYFKLDGRVEWLDNLGEQSATLSEAEDDEQGRALETFLLREETWHALVDRWVTHWKGWRQEVYPSRAICIAANQKHARDIVAYLRKVHAITAALAISDDADSHDRLECFRKGAPEVLVTVGMASVGYDVKDCTHLCYLSRYRSLPWGLQAFARVTRIDYRCNLAPEYQRAAIFVPDDPKMNSIVEWLEREQQMGISEKRESEREVASADGEANLFVPIGGEALGMRVAQVGSTLSEGVQALLLAHPEMASEDPEKLAKILRFASGGHAPAPEQKSRRTRKEVSAELDTLAKLCGSQRAGRSGCKPGDCIREVNGQLVRMFGPKEQRTDAQLEASIAAVKQWMAG